MVSNAVGNADLVIDGILGLWDSGKGESISEAAETELGGKELQGKESDESEEIDMLEESRSMRYLALLAPKRFL